jgi:hypothetical protein
MANYKILKRRTIMHRDPQKNACSGPCAEQLHAVFVKHLVRQGTARALDDYLLKERTAVKKAFVEHSEPYQRYIVLIRSPRTSKSFQHARTNHTRRRLERYLGDDNAEEKARILLHGTRLRKVTQKALQRLPTITETTQMH